MKNAFENLLPVDPLGAFEKIKENYRRYFQSAYQLRTELSDQNNSALDRERISLLEKDDNLYKSPYLEMLPKYNVASAKDLKDIKDGYIRAFGSQDKAELFEKFIENGLMSYTPYVHQKEMLERAFFRGENTIITSGTGSGKTEAFLLPLLAQIFQEALTWSPNTYTSNWHQTIPYVPSQRSGETRDAALRAIVLYPMNALVEDQVRRLRKALDSDQVRSLMDDPNGLLKGNRIFFGQYNGSTIGTKSFNLLNGTPYLKSAQNKIENELSTLADHYKSIMAQLSINNDDAYISTRLDGKSATSEMVTRWDMQQCPPDIMITNVSMLSIMLMRTAEERIISKTRDWLKDDPYRKGLAEKPTRIFHLVVDELHLYRDTAGSEVACLLRMLLHQLDLLPVIDDGKGNKIPNPQLRILASSASLGNKKQTQAFLEEFFGVYNSTGADAFEIQEGSDYTPKAGAPLAYDAFGDIKPDFVMQDDQTQKNIAELVVTKIQGSPDLQSFANTYQNTIYSDFDKITHPNGMTGINVEDMIIKNGHGLFPNIESLRGFLIFRAYLDRAGIDHELPRFRFHQFFKYIEGLWGELQPTVINQRNGTQQIKQGQEPISDLAYTPKEIGSHKHKILELLRCECCGQLYIGGNINRDKSNAQHLSLNYPNLENIPSYNPTPMVQNKSYHNYAIFYPTHEQNIQLDRNEEEDHCSLLSDGNSTYSSTHAQATWTHAYLSPLTGEVKANQGIPDGEWIEGYIYDLESYNNQTFDPKQISALPCTCPHCKMNYMKRKYVKSPIRSFRTGIDRSNQLLSKELIYQLSEQDKKLIGFSDSREDAAKQAAGIAIEHYRDMVRVLFIDAVKEKLDKHNSQDPNISIQLIKDYVDQLRNKGMNDNDIPDEVDKKYPLNGYKYASQYIRGTLLPIPFTPINTISIADFDRDNGPIAKRLIDLGINPRGAQPHDENWCENYATRTGNSIEELRTAIFNNAFGLYMGVSICDTGIGYIRIDPNIISQCDPTTLGSLSKLLGTACGVQDFLDSFLRVMGDSYRYQNPDFPAITPYTQYADCKASMKLYVERAAKILNCQPLALGNALFNVLKSCTRGSHGNSYQGGGLQFMIIDMQSLAFRIVNKDANYYYCEKCHRVHPIKGLGFCTRCGGKLQISNDTNQDLWRHYISYDIMREKREPMRLHTEELTGQTDDIQSRLLQFKDFVFTDSTRSHLHFLRKQSLPIDMVCVTTTMEVGVDIGSLEAIYQGNMPPTRYNYQQRVGRGGRRGQAFATAMTFCRGRSHDLYYYEKATNRIVGGKVEPPTLALAPYQDANGFHIKQSIMQRVITKHIMRIALTGLYNPDLQDTAAEFDTVEEWKNGNTKTKLVIWLQTYPKTVHDIVHYYYDQFNTQKTPISSDINEVETWINNDLVSKIDGIVQSYPDPLVGLGQCLVEMGVLPKYGMPLDVRYFYHGYNFVHDEKIRTIDRSSEMAITEFAPGAEKTKDKGKYQVAAICVPMKIGKGNKPIYVNPNADALENKYVANLSATANDSPITNIVPYSSGQVLTSQDKIIILPQAYRADEIEGNRGKSIDNNDRGSRFAQSEVWANNGSRGSSQTIKNCKISAFGFASNDAEVWHLNTNARKWYYGHYGISNLPMGGNTTFTFDDGKKQGSMEIGLGSRKVTEMVCIEMENIPPTLDLNCDTGNSSAIRAAFISAGFLLQRTLADKLDVTPEEIEVIEKIQNGKPMIYLSDALPNGAGIVGYLYKNNNLEDLLKEIVNFSTPFMQSLKDPQHRKKCFTACQECLDSYSNRGYHHILDWRMGVGILRLMLDDQFDFGFDANKRSLYEDLVDYDDIFNAASIKLDGASSLKWNNHLYATLTQIQGVGPSAKSTTTYKVLYHPLWNKHELFSKYLSQVVGSNIIEYYNLFKVLRSDLTPDEGLLPSTMVTTTPATSGSTSTVNSNQTGNGTKVKVGNLTITQDVDLS